MVEVGGGDADDFVGGVDVLVEVGGAGGAEVQRGEREGGGTGGLDGVFEALFGGGVDGVVAFESGGVPGVLVDFDGAVVGDDGRVG